MSSSGDAALTEAETRPDMPTQQQGNGEVTGNGTTAAGDSNTGKTADGAKDEADVISAVPKQNDDVSAEAATQKTAAAAAGETVSSGNRETAAQAGPAEARKASGETIYISQVDFTAACQRLVQFGRVILCGPPGSGKSFLGRTLLKVFKERGYVPRYSVEMCGMCHMNLSEGPGPKRIFLVDGMMGEVRCHRDTFHSCMTFLNNTQRIWKREQTEFNALLIITVYPHILKDLQYLDYGSYKPLTNPKVIVRLTQDPIHPTLPLVATVETYVPLFVRMVRECDFGDTITALFAMTMNGYTSYLYNPPPVQKEVERLGIRDMSCQRLEEYADFLRDSIFPLDRSGFMNRAMYDAAGLALARAYSITLLLKVCDAKFIAEYLRMDEDGTTTLTSYCFDKYYQQELMVARMYDLMVDGALKELGHHPSLAYLPIVQMFSDYCSGQKNFTERLMGVGDTEHGLPLLYWSVWNSANHFNYWCLTSMMGQAGKGKTLSEATLTALFASILFAESGDNTLLVARDFVREVANLKYNPTSDNTKLSLPFPTLRPEDVNVRLEQVKTRLQSSLRFLEDPELPLPNKLLTVTVTEEDHLSVELPSKNWYLVLRLLTDKDKDETDGKGNTVLHLAAENGDLEAIGVIVKSGASVTTRNKKGLTPPQVGLKRKKPTGKEPGASEESSPKDLHTACEEGDVNKVKVLLCHGVSPQDKDAQGSTPLHTASRRGHTDLVALLLQLEADVNAKTSEGLTPLHEASRGGYLDLARILVEHNADVNVKNRQGSLPLHLACTEGHTGLAALMIQHHADINAKDRGGSLPLFLASKNAHVDTVRLLLQLHADVNAKNANGATALHAACEGGHVEVVSLLLQHKAEVTLKDSGGRSPADVVRESGHQDPVFEELLSRAT